MTPAYAVRFQTLIVRTMRRFWGWLRRGGNPAVSSEMLEARRKADVMINMQGHDPDRY
jgi:hypothetical protein